MYLFFHYTIMFEKKAKVAAAPAPTIGDSVNELTASLREAVKAFPLASQMTTHIDAIEHLMFVK